MAKTRRRLQSYLGLIVNGDLGPITFYTSKRGKVVSFPKAPPLLPASYSQSVNRNRFRLAAAKWNQQSADTKAKWQRACRRAKLRCHGYDLFVSTIVRGETSYVETIEHQTGIQLLPIM